MVEGSTPNNFVDPLLAPLLPNGKPRCEFIVIGDEVGQHGCIFDCHCGALGSKWGHRVGSIADKCSAFCCPCSIRIDAVQWPRRPATSQIHKLAKLR